MGRDSLSPDGLTHVGKQYTVSSSTVGLGKFLQRTASRDVERLVEAHTAANATATYNEIC